MATGATFTLENGKEIAASIEKSGTEINRVVRLEFKKFGRDVQAEARNNHKYETDTGMLERSIEYKATPDGDGVEIWADLGIAPYARRIHEGWGTWVRDPFLKIAFNRQAQNLGDRIQKAISKALGAK
jgi:hypothetical protein